jgi:hypothetical protein
MPQLHERAPQLSRKVSHTSLHGRVFAADETDPHLCTLRA